ncbi:Photosystem I assembly protein Ycf3 [uncultured archaeon]|nr:Photosystem I assembly protein Ycf3 [uncultured archaeon]
MNYSNLGSAQINLGESWKAIEYYEKALGIAQEIGDRRAEEVYFSNLGDAHANLGMARKAIEYYEKALGIAQEIGDKQNESIWLSNLGISYSNLGMARKSIEYLNNAVMLAHQTSNSSFEAACLSYLAQMHSLLKDYKTTSEICHEVAALTEKLEAQTRKAEIFLRLGDLSVELKSFEEAADRYMEAREIYASLKLPLDELNALIGMLAIHRKLKDAKAFEQTAEEAHALAWQINDPIMRVNALVRLVESLRFHEEYDRVLKIIDEALALQPDNPLVLRVKGDVLCDMADYRAAVEILEKVTQLNPFDSRGFASKGWALENLGKERTQEARLVYETLIELNPDNLWAHKGLANAMRLLGDTKAAVNKYQWIIEQQEKRDVADAGTMNMTGWCYYQLEHYDKAIQLLTNALILDPDDVSDQFDLALSLMCSGEHSKALQEYQRGLEKAQSKHVLHRRGLLYVALDDLKEALTTKPELRKVKEVQGVQKRLKMVLDQAKASLL